MKKIIAAAALLLLSLNGFAQLNVGAGYLFDFGTYKARGEKMRTDNMHGIYAGASYNFEIASGFGIAPGAYLTLAGGTDRRSDGGKAIERMGSEVLRFGHRHMSIVVPVYATYSFDLGPGALFAYTGPSFQGGISYKDYEKGRVNSHKVSNVSENLFSRDYDLRPFDLKYGIGFGYRWNFIQANLGFEFGLIDREPTDGLSHHFHAIHFGAAYVF